MMRQLIYRRHILKNSNRILCKELSSAKMYAGNGILGIVREDFSIWERRSPLCPHHVTELTKQGKI